jgi:hypothetical protein
VPRPQISRAHPWTPASGAFAGETFRSERQYRNALARSHGYRSWTAQQQARAPKIRFERDLRRLRPSGQLAHEKAGSVLTRMRREGVSLSQAVKLEHTTPAAVRRHAGDALVRSTRGRFEATSVDRHYRRLWFVTPTGLTIVETRDSRAATLVAEYDNAVQRFLATGNSASLDRFEGRVLRAGGRSYPFVTDLDVFEELGRQGEISFESIYASAA